MFFRVIKNQSAGLGRLALRGVLDDSDSNRE